MTSDIWEPWQPTVGQRVRVRLSPECKTACVNAAPPPTVMDDQLRSMMRNGVDVARRYQGDTWIEGHPAAVDGVEGEITSIDRADEMMGHYYRVMFDQTIEPGALIGVDLAAIELEPIS